MWIKKIILKYLERCRRLCIGWCHCFREPEKYIKSGIPKLLIESDFNSKLYYNPNLPKIYDYISIQPKDKDCKIGWNGVSKMGIS